MRRRARALPVAVCWLLGLAANFAGAQPAPTAAKPRFGEGTHAFRRLLFDRQFRPLANSRELTESPTRSLLVVFGHTWPLEQLEGDLGGLASFVKQGGALLVATDRLSTPALMTSFGVAVDGEVVLPNLPALTPTYRGLPECPFALPVRNASPPLFQARTLPGQQSAPFVAANLPSQLIRLRTQPPALPLLAVLPALASDGRSMAAFAVGGDVGAGRVLIMADHSVFINDMMLQPDNGNIDFAYRCAEWLQRSPAAPRDRVLYYEDGVIRRDFDIPLKDVPPPPIPSPEELVPIIDQTLHGLEEENAFNDMLLHAVGEDVLWKALAVAACAALSVYGFVRLGLFRHRHDAATPTLAKLLGQQEPVASLIDQRTVELLREDNLWEAARALARDLFPAAGAAPPTVQARGGWWQRRHWGRLVGRLWRLAHAARPARVSTRRFVALAAEVNQLRTALADGTVRITRGTTSDAP